MQRAEASAAALAEWSGVGPSCVALPEGPWLTLIAFLVYRFPRVSREEWIARMQRGEVTDAQGIGVLPDAPFTPYAKLYYYRKLPTEPHIPFEEAVLYQDEFIVVADKPHFLPVTPSGRFLQETLLVRLKRKLGLATLAPVHRIDRETMGVVLFTVQPHTRGRYQALFRDRVVEKRYEAIARARTDLLLPYTHVSRMAEGGSFMTMQEVPGEPNTETRIELLESLGAEARYGLRPTTGKRHQLRVHMAALGIPIVNDRIYPTLQPDTPHELDYSHPLQLLARSLEFTDPMTGRLCCFESRHRLGEDDAPALLQARA